MNGGLPPGLRSVVKLLIVLSAILALTPALASKGGQWAKWLIVNTNQIDPFSHPGPGVVRDYYFPQSKLWPSFAIAYLLIFIIIIYLAFKWYRSAQWVKLQKLFIAYILLPLLGVVVLLVSGFDYTMCHAPANTLCHDPTQHIAFSVVDFLSVSIIPVLIYKWLFRTKNK